MIPSGTGADGSCSGRRNARPNDRSNPRDRNPQAGSLTQPKPGVFIFDMGQNLVGWCRLKVSGPRGTDVSLRHAETLKPDGTLYLDNIRGRK